jgi:hypothetical protein
MAAEVRVMVAEVRMMVAEVTVMVAEVRMMVAEVRAMVTEVKANAAEWTENVAGATMMVALAKVVEMGRLVGCKLQPETLWKLAPVHKSLSFPDHCMAHKMSCVSSSSSSSSLQLREKARVHLQRNTHVQPCVAE